MKPPFLSLLLLGALVSGAHSQEAASGASPEANDAEKQLAADIQREWEANAGSKKVEVGTGFYWLLRASETLGANPNPVPVVRPAMTPAERLNYDREFLAYYSESLKMLHTALQKGIAVPMVDGRAFETGMLGLQNYNANFRQLARVLDSESNVRLADGDAGGALDSRLDCLEMGVAVSRGPLISMLVGVAIEAIGRKGIETIAPRLDAAQCRVAAARWRQIEARRPTFAAVLRLEGQSSLDFAIKTLSDTKARAELQTEDGRKSLGLSDRQVRQLLALSPQNLRSNNARLFGAAIGAASLAPHLAAMVPLPDGGDYFTDLSRFLLGWPRTRFNFERNVVQNRLMMSALELHAQKLENGAYPATFAAPLDPFTDQKPLIYHLDGASYRLYSIGPDFKNNGGRAVSSTRIVFDRDSGQTRLVKARNLAVFDRGDILAPVF